MAATCKIRAQYPAAVHPLDGGLFASSASVDTATAAPIRLNEDAPKEKKIAFCHPGYAAPQDILLLLPAYDVVAESDGSGSTRFGVHHETARIACAIKANCRWDGYLSEESGLNAERVSAGPDDVLLGERYYFHVQDIQQSSAGAPLGAPALDRRYPVVPSFAHFRFPHNDLPLSWSAMTIPRPPVQLSRLATVTERDARCRLTNHTYGTETAHLVPRAEDAWFNANAMYRYMGEADQGASDSRNSILLRSDVRTLFDQNKLAIVPKSNSWVGHVPAGEGLPTEELAGLYHNVRLQPLAGVSVECLFARFAWTVIQLSPMFLKANVPRKLVIVQGIVSSVRYVSGPECRIYCPTPGGKSRSQSPKKRLRDDSVGDDDDYSSGFVSWDDGDSPPRGRSRKRQRHDWSDAGRSTTSSFTLLGGATPQDALLEVASPATLLESTSPAVEAWCGG